MIEIKTMNDKAHSFVKTVLENTIWSRYQDKMFWKNIQKKRFSTWTTFSIPSLLMQRKGEMGTEIFWKKS